MSETFTLRGTPSVDLQRAAGELLEQRVLASVVCSDRTGSTNQDAMDEWSFGIRPEHLPRMHVTEEQIAGRGRQGRQWLRSDHALALSIMFQFDVPRRRMNTLSPAIGVAVAEAAEYFSAPTRIGLKWPNDICVCRADGTLLKLGGILIETTTSQPGAVVVGIGLNLRNPPEITNSFSAVSLSELCLGDPRRHEVISAVTQSVCEAVGGWLAEDPSLQRRYQDRCVLNGRNITLQQVVSDDTSQAFSGKCAGMGEDGSLQIQVDGDLASFHTGEVTQIRTVD